MGIFYLSSVMGIDKGIPTKTEPGDIIKEATGIYGKRRRMVNGKRRTIWVQIGDPTPKERKQMERLFVLGNGFALRMLIAKIIKRYKHGR